MAYPKISIVTPSYNQAEYIEETILSIINQNYPQLEYVIIDGGSTDGSVEIIEKYERYLKYWISEPDKGQVDAINKGLVHCTGDIFNWINSDDFLAENALYSIAKAYQEGFSIAGIVVNFTQGENTIIKNKNLNINCILSGVAKYHQPGFWYCLRDLNNSNNFDEKYHYCFDIIHLLEYLLSNEKVKYIDQELVYFRLHELSKTGAGQLNFEIEMLDFLKKMRGNEKFRPFKSGIKSQIKLLEPQVKGRQLSTGDPASVKNIFKQFYFDIFHCPAILLNRFYLSSLLRSLKNVK